MAFTFRPVRAHRFWHAATPVAILIGAGLAFSASAVPSPQSPQESHATDRSREQSTGLNDQTDLAVTVYNSNIALVRDLRQLSLPSGPFRLKLMDIAATVNPATVHLRSLNEPERLGVSHRCPLRLRADGCGTGAPSGRPGRPAR